MPDEPSWRWSWILGLSGNVAVAFGTLLYAFSVLLTDEAAGAEYSTSVLSVAYGGSVLVGGLLAYRIGRHADRQGVRGIVALGGLLGAAGLAGFGVAREPWHVMLVSWFLIGPAGGLSFYEPAFVAVDQWFGRRYRARALATLTVVGGLAGPVFIPFTGFLVTATGWRSASLILGAITVVSATAAAVFVLPRAALRGEARPDVAALPSGLLRDRRFVLFTAAMFLVYGSLQAVFFHRIAVFEEAGFTLATVTGWAAVAGLLSFPGRSGAPYLAEHLGAVRLQAVSLVAQAASVVLMIGGTRPWQMGGHFVVFGLMLGTVLPLRAVIMGDWYSGAGYGRIMGAQWSVTAVAGAAGSSAIGVLRDAVGGYDLPMGIVAGALLAGAALTVASGRADAIRAPGG